MGWKVNRETAELEPWTPPHIPSSRSVEFISLHGVTEGRIGQIPRTAILPLRAVFDSLNWKLFALSITAYFSFCLFITPAWALTGAELDALVPKIIQAESSGRTWAVGDGGHSRGLMQVSKETWKAYSNYSWEEAFDGDKNVQVGRAILEDINEKYGNRATVKLVIFSYNTGRFVKDESDLPAWTLKHPNRIYRRIFNAG